MKSLLCLLALGTLLFSGCVKEEVEYTKKWGFGFKDKGVYKKLTNYDLTLELSPGSRKLTAGVPGELVFILRNRGKGAVRLEEWFKFDPNNLLVQCQVWLPGTDRPESQMWLNVSVPVKKPIWRYPLTLPPGGAHFVSTRLDFPANLVISPGAERRFFIKAKLNLKSVNVASETDYITIYPGTQRQTPGYSQKNQKVRQ